MIIDLAKWNNYFGISLTDLPFGKREELNALTLFFTSFIHLPRYDTLTLQDDKEAFEYALMEQINHFIENDNLANGNVSNLASFSIEGYSESFNAGNDIGINNKSKRISPNAYNYLQSKFWTYQGLA